MPVQRRFLIQLLVALGLLLLFPLAANAGPPRPGVVTLTQPDGSTFQARVWGDEREHGMQTLTGYTILLDPQTQYWVYAVRSPAGALIPATGPQGKFVVGKSNPAALPKTVSPLAPLRNRAAISTAATRTNTGTQKVLVLLAKFSDQDPIGTDETYWHNLYFGATNSVAHYYDQASYNHLHFAPAEENFGTANNGVVGWLALSGTFSAEMNGDQFVKDAILAADPFVNFAAFDANNDGYISVDELHIAVVAAGYEYAYVVGGACGQTIWGHQSAFGDSSAPVVDGVKVGDYAQGGAYTTLGEWHCDTTEAPPGHGATIGLPSHELGHDLGLPDMYDMSGVTAGIGDWAIMSTGVWTTNGGLPGDSPANPDAWSRWYEGWLTPTQVTGSLTGVNIPQIETSPTAFLLSNNPNGIDWRWETQSGTGEYFLVENRQQTLSDAGIPGCGLLIWHIDESVSSDNYYVNLDPNHRFIDLEQADGLRQLNLGDGGNSGDAGDPFPGTSFNHTFNASSNPNSHLYSGLPSNVAVTNISSSCSSTMSANLAYTPPPSIWLFLPLIGKHFP